ncbi:MAG: methyltransferase domain-containing protein, partial [Promethearchaeota archaeon]
MAVVYMRKLEEEPETYDKNFTTLTKGVNLEVNEWILEKIGKSETILEVGCGTGSLASKMAIKGNKVMAIDKNYKMISHAMQNYPIDSDVNLSYQIGTLSDFSIESQSKDILVSTFMLSELRPLEQQIFLRNSWKALKPGGRVLLAAEFIPTKIWKIPFKIKRWWYKKKLKLLRLNQTHLLHWFLNYLEPIGFYISDQKKWKHGAIQVLELKKRNPSGLKKPGYYMPKLAKFKGIKSRLKILRCLLTGQVDKVPIEPGIYQSGNPTKDSPIIVTSNYEYTYIKVMNDLKGIDARVLCVDSNGINVWCAARGNNFENNQLLEAVEATGIQDLATQRMLILPQLAAGGISKPLLPEKSKSFPFIIKYGPIWSSSLPQYLKDMPNRKTEKMRVLKFSLSHRTRAFITHTSFLFRKVFLLPIVFALALFLVLSIIFPHVWTNKMILIGEVCLWIILTNALHCFLFPISNFTRKFINKGIFFGGINIIVLGILTYLLHESILIILLNMSFFFWIGFFSTMSFSGYTMSTNPKEIQNEYPLFTKLNRILLAIS